MRNLADLARLNRLPGGTAASIEGIGHLIGSGADARVLDVGHRARRTCRSRSRSAGWRTTALDTNPDVLLVARRETAAQPLVESSRATAGRCRSTMAPSTWPTPRSSSITSSRPRRSPSCASCAASPVGASWSTTCAAGSCRSSRPVPARSLFGRSRVTWTDGLASARRSYTLAELDDLLGEAGLAHPLAVEPLDATRRDGGIGRPMSVTSVDVLVAGAGPAGSALAAAPGRGRAHRSCSSRLRHTHAPRPAPSTRARASSRSSPGWASDRRGPQLAVPLDRHGPARRRPHDPDPIRRPSRAARPHGASTVARSTRCWPGTRSSAARVLMERTRVASLVVEAGRVRGARVRDVARRADRGARRLDRGGGWHPLDDQQARRRRQAGALSPPARPGCPLRRASPSWPTTARCTSGDTGTSAWRRRPAAS